MGKTDYEKLLKKLENLEEKEEGLYEKLKRVVDYAEGVPWDKMPYWSRENLYQNAVQPILEKIAERIEKHVEAWKNYWSIKGRWRPVYEYITDVLMNFTVNSPKYMIMILEDLEKQPMRVYKDLAVELNVSWRTIRDYFSLTRFRELI